MTNIGITHLFLYGRSYVQLPLLQNNAFRLQIKTRQYTQQNLQSAHAAANSPNTSDLQNMEEHEIAQDKYTTQSVCTASIILEARATTCHYSKHMPTIIYRSPSLSNDLTAVANHHCRMSSRHS
jgi:hypothetical protein